MLGLARQPALRHGRAGRRWRLERFDVPAAIALSAAELTDLADVFGVELVVIDADTTRPSLAKELRWSAAYHRLAQGL